MQWRRGICLRFRLILGSLLWNSFTWRNRIVWSCRQSAQLGSWFKPFLQSRGYSSLGREGNTLSITSALVVWWMTSVSFGESSSEISVAAMKNSFIRIAAFAILIYFSANVVAHLMIFTNFNPNLLVFETTVFSKEITCQEYFVQLSGKQEKVKVCC